MTIDKGQINTRERALSSDWNRQVELGNRGIVTALSASLSGIGRDSGVIGENSYLVTPLNGSMNSAISQGLALFFDPTKLYPQSNMVWCESREIRQVTHPPADALARWDVVEMRPGSLISSTQPRDQFDPLTGTFTVVNMTKEIKSYPEFQVRSGTPSASPGIPNGVAGWMPLAYVYVAGNAVTVDNTRVVYCRPLLGSRLADQEGWTTSASSKPVNVVGGGVSVAGGSLIGTVANSMEGRFPGCRHKFRVDATAELRITPMVYDGGGMPASNGVLYFYAVPPPYPSGYDSTMVGRELWTPDTANLYGNNGGFTDVTKQTGCIVVASTTPPSLTHPSGAPSGFGSFTHEFFRDVGASSSARSSWVYIGAAFYDHALTQLIAQRVNGKWTAPARKTGASYQADLPIGPPKIYNMWAGVGAAFQLPVTARRLSMQVFARISAGATLVLEMQDHWTGQGNTGENGGLYVMVYNGSAGLVNASQNFEGAVEANGDLVVESGSVSGGVVNTGRFVARAYEDAVFALR